MGKRNDTVINHTYGTAKPVGTNGGRGHWGVAHGKLSPLNF